MNTPDPPSSYDPASVSRDFDEYGLREWNRLIETPSAEVSLYIHTCFLEKSIRPQMRVLEVGAGAGRFTQILARLEARVTVADISQGQLDLNRSHSNQFGFDQAIEDWRQVDVCDMARFPDSTFDAVVAYGGLFSYVLDQRERALAETLRMLVPGGTLLLSVMSLWGSAHSALNGVLAVPSEANQRIISTGDLTPATFPDRRRNWMHLFRVDELRSWLEKAGLHNLELSAASCLSANWDEQLKDIRQDDARWKELLRMEREACLDPACLGMGTHLIASGSKAG